MIAASQQDYPQASFRKIKPSKDVLLIIFLFLFSRLIIGLFDVSMDYTALFRYWQYLDVETLKNNLWKGVWYDHAQPPVFNLILGIILKSTGGYAEIVFSLLLKLLSLLNSLLLLSILKRTTSHRFIPLVLSVIYLLSPATIIFENELFYTNFISTLLLISCSALIRISHKITAANTVGFFIPLVLICLTRSMYHLLFLVVLSLIALFYYRKKPGYRLILAGAIFSILITGTWYLKNYVIFKSFSTSSWMGMNIARNVFHDANLKDSTLIETIEPFSKISQYTYFLPPNYEQEYKGLNDKDLLQEMKNDSFINENHVGYLVISKKYMEASKYHVKKNPAAYLQNVVQSGIIFFAPATRYPTTEHQAVKIKYYDILYSFNLSHFAQGKQERRIALAVSAIPKIIIYFFVFWIFIRDIIRRRKVAFLHIFISAIILYIFCVSSLFEHYENMRFRYEIEPLFIILAGFVLTILFSKNKKLVWKTHILK